MPDPIALLSVSLLTNYSAVFVVISLTVLVLARRERGLVLPWTVTVVAVGIVFLPWFLDWYERVGAARIFTDRPRRFDVPLRAPEGFSITYVPYLFWVFSFGYSLGPPVLDLHVDRSARSILAHWPTLSAGAFSIGVAAALGVREIGRRGRGWIFIGLLLMPLALAVLLTLRDIKAFNVRYVMVAYPPFVALLAAGWRSRGTLRTVSAVVAVALTGISLANHYFDPCYAREDMRAASRIVLGQERPGDSVVVIDDFQTFRYYFDRGAGRAPVFHVHKRFLRSPADIRDHVRDVTEGSSRVWLVLSRWWEVASKDEIHAAFETVLDRRRHWPFHGVVVTLYEPKERGDQILSSDAP